MFRTGPPPSALSSHVGASSSSYGHGVGANDSTTGQVSTHPTGGRANALKYPFRLNFHDKPPLDEVTMEEFEVWAIDRLRVLAEIEASHARNRPYEELKSVVLGQCKKHLPLSASTAKNVDLDTERRKDHVSHFVLRLAFCRSEELRRRFLKAESTLFRIRFEEDDAGERQRFLRSLDFDWKAVTPDEKEMYKAQLLGASGYLKDNEKWAAEQFYKVSWTRVTDLVERRRVFVKGGMAYVPSREQSSLVIAEFQSRLSQGLEMTAKALPRLDEDDRLIPVLAHLSMGFLAGVTSDYTSTFGENGEKITADMIDGLAKRHFPLCMRNLYDQLKRTHHLRHFGRLQFNLFLKELGLPIEEALAFWRKSFSNMTDDKFNKEYRYNIRHGYGLEGRRMNYPAKSCQAILTRDTPGPQDSHGCPFRHFSPDNLASALSSTYQLSHSDQKEILDAVKGGHYHVGCTRLFEITHEKYGVRKGDGLGGGESVNHPNKYFERSWTVARETEGEGAAIKEEPREHQVEVTKMELD